MTVQTPLTLDDYDAIASAVMETERGRWFMAEFARRNRGADTAAVLTALGDLERALADKRVDREEPARLAPPPSPPPSEDAKKTAELLRRIAERSALIRNELGVFTQGTRIIRIQRQLDQLERLVGLAMTASGCPREDVAAVIAQRPTPERPAAVEARAVEAPEPVQAPAASAKALEPVATAEALPTTIPETAKTAPEEASRVAVSPEIVVNGHAIDILAASDDTAAPVSTALSDPVPDDWSDEPIFVSAPPEAAESPEAVVAADEIAKDVGSGDPNEAAPPSAPAAPAQQKSASEIMIEGLAPQRTEPALDDEPHPRSADGGRPKMPAAWTPTLLESLSEEEKAILFA